MASVSYTHLDVYKRQAYMSLGKYESEYEQDMDDAKSIISGFKFWKTGSQREKMQQLSDEISALNAKVAKYQKAYEEATAKMEKDSKYFLGDYEDKYNEAKDVYKRQTMIPAISNIQNT